MLFVCSACQLCAQAASYCREWVGDLPDVSLEIIRIRQRPAQFVRLGLMYTPALVIDGQVVAQNVSVDRLADLLSTHHG